MSIRISTIVILISTFGTAHTSDAEIAESWVSAFASRVEAEFREEQCGNKYFEAFQGTTRDYLIIVISEQYALCTVNGYVHLAKTRSIPLDDVLVNVATLDVNWRLFSSPERHDAIGHCMSTAYETAGLKFD